MAVHLASGTTPQRSDPRRFLLIKILNALQLKGGSLPANDPQPNDTVRRLRGKIVRARAGVTSPF